MAKRAMPEGGWSIEQIAAVVGADAVKMRRHAINVAVAYGLKEGRYIQREADVERLLHHAEEYDADPVQVIDRWFGHGPLPTHSDLEITAHPPNVAAALPGVRRPGESAQEPAAAAKRDVMEGIEAQLERLNNLLERLVDLAERAPKQ